MATVNQDPHQFIQTGFQPSTERLDVATHSAWSIILTRDVPEHGPVKFKVTQFLDQQKSNTRVKVELVDFEWAPEIDDEFEVWIQLGEGSYPVAASKKRLQLNEDKLWPVFDLNKQLPLRYNCWSVKLMVTERAAADHAAPVGWLVRRRFDQIYKKPACFERLADRFTLKSEEGREFYVHLFVLGEFSPVLTNWMEENHMNLASGEPYAVELSTAALNALLTAMYLGEIRFSFIRNCHKIVKVAELLLMNQIKEWCINQMNKNLEKQDFELLMQWFLVCCEFSLDECKLGVAILQQLAELAQTNETNKTSLQAQIEQLMHAHPDKMAKLFPVILQIGNELAYTSIVASVKENMELRYKKEEFDTLLGWFDCAAYSLHDHNLAHRILLQLSDMSVNDAKCAQVEAQLEQYWTQNAALDIALLFEAWTLADNRLNVLFMTKLVELGKLNETNKTLLQDQMKKYLQDHSADVICKAVLDLVFQLV